MNKTVQDNFVVTLNYTLIVEDETLESTKDGEPILFIQGIGQIIPGLENALYGMEVGDQKTVVIQPEDAYGEYDPESLQEAKKEEFSEEMENIAELILEKKGFSVTLHKIRSKINQYKNHLGHLNEVDISHIVESIEEWEKRLL